MAVDPRTLLTERAGDAGAAAGGQISWGGGSRLLACADGWVGVTLGRSTDWDLVPALLELPAPVIAGDWATVGSGVAALDGPELRRRAALLGLPLALVGERRSSAAPVSDGVPGTRTHGMRAIPGATGDGDGLIVADLTALWAGPLVGRLLARMGARVTKIESVDRPDGARRGDPGFYERLNEGKTEVTLDFHSADGRHELEELVSEADVVITACRPRALDQLGLDAEGIVRSRRPRAWVRISGYGPGGSSENRAAFGDDAAVAGGLVAWRGATPAFYGDAVADPVTGLAATAALLATLESDTAAVIDISMADVAGGLTLAPADLEGFDLWPQ